MEEKDYLIIKESTLPNAGRGLFTTKDIKKYEIVAKYEGEILTYGEYMRRNIKGDNEYFILCESYDMMDSKNIECFAKYANDASYDNLDNTDYYQFNERPNRPDNNTDIRQYKNNINYLIANRDIKEGEEIFTSYGESYWINQNLKYITT